MTTDATRAGDEALPEMPIRTTTSDLGALYGLEYADEAFQPKFGKGDTLHFSTVDRPAAGDIVAVWMRPKFVKPARGQVFIYRLRTAPPADLAFPFDDPPESECRPVVVLETGGDGRVGSILCSEILGIHKMTAVIYADEGKAARS